MSSTIRLIVCSGTIILLAPLTIYWLYTNDFSMVPVFQNMRECMPWGEEMVVFYKVIIFFHVVGPILVSVFLKPNPVMALNKMIAIMFIFALCCVLFVIHGFPAGDHVDGLAAIVLFFYCNTIPGGVFLLLISHIVVFAQITSFIYGLWSKLYYLSNED